MFRERTKVPNLVRVFTLRPGQSMTVQICPDILFHYHVMLHWIKEEKRSVPCMDADCKVHDLPKRYCTYVPCREWLNPQQRFQNRIAALGVGRDVVLDHPNVGSVVWTARKGNYLSAEVTWKYEEPKIKLPMFEGFDILPSLCHMWGIDAVDAYVSLKASTGGRGL